MVSELHASSDVERVAAQILEALSAPFYLDDEAVHLSTSIGIAFYPDNAKDIETLVKNADQACTSRSQKGEIDFQYFGNAMQQTAMDRMLMVKDLHKALSNQ